MDEKKIGDLLIKGVQKVQKLNAQRNPRTNTILIAGVILLGGFMLYNYTAKSLTTVASDSYTAVATPTLSPTPTSRPVTNDE